MQRNVYIETSVLSYYTGRTSRDLVIAGRQEATREFWDLLGSTLSPHISTLVAHEASKGDAAVAARRLAALDTFPILGITPEAEQLAEDIVDAHGVPKEFPEDALHIAIAATAGMEFIVTWNFAHINNPFTKLMIRQTIENAGFDSPEIVSPDAFLGGES